MTKRSARQLFYFTTTSLWILVASAVGQFVPVDLSDTEDEPEVTVSLVSPNKTIQPGEPFTVALRMEHAKGWHTYWKNSGGVQFGPMINWELPDGFDAGELEWPTPKKDFLQGYHAYVYGGTNYLFTTITPPADLANGSSIDLKGAMRWQHCDETSCILGTDDVSLTLEVGDNAVIDEAIKTELDAFREKNFSKSLEGWTVEAAQAGSELQLTLKPDKASTHDFGSVYFFSEDKRVDGQAEQSFEAKNGGGVLTVSENPDEFARDDWRTDGTLPGVLYAENGWSPDGPKAFIIAPKVGESAGGGGKTATDGAAEASYLYLLWAAFLGGLILNLMPCVFPVIGLKIMGFVSQAGEDRKKIALHGVIFAVGVLLSFLVLAALFYPIRTEGWGFQMQKPWFVFGISALLLVVALNMAGVFEFGAKATSVGGNLMQKSGMSGSFFSGVLATIVATPCTAPFLAVALAAASGLAGIQFFLLFVMIAIGLATPYLVLSAFPGLLKFLPRPGAWMDAFKVGLSFLLFGAAAYFVWAYFGLVDESTHPAIIVGFTIIAFAIWIYGRFSVHGKPGRGKVVANVLALIFAVIGGYVARPVPPSGWKDWSPEFVTELRDAGQPVYIDFTARWCATCQTNKRVYRNEAVKDLIREKDVALLKADWTQPDPRIANALQGYGKSAIPVNVLYYPGEEEPFLFGELLTAGAVSEALEKIQ
ncbi:MAG: protein-disulfide reductase DsbD domain-containing protein [Verrucomicrobiota bacterium]